nr:reverse transcriptase domain-containing protein [Tanacetum cinerariifolium]
MTIEVSGKKTLITYIYSTNHILTLTPESNRGIRSHGHRRQSAFDRLSETYSPSTTKSRLRGTGSRDHPRGRIRPHSLNTSKENRPNDRERLRGVGESYDDSFSHSYRDGNRSRHMKRRRDNESPLSIMSRSDSSDGRYQRSKRHKSTDEDDLTKPWMCEEEDPFTPRIQVERWAMPTWRHMFNSTLIGAARVWFDEPPPESIDGYKDLKAAFLTYFMQQKKYVKDPVEIHNIKQKDGETIEDFMERFKVETGRVNGAPECMRISGFMHGVNNPTLIKRLNEHVPKTMKEMMITTTAFIRGKTAAASKKKGHASWKAHDQSKKQNSDKRSDFRGHSREGRGSNQFTPLTGTPKEILAAEAGKFQPPPPMKKVTQGFERVKEITFPPLPASSGTEGPLVIEAEMGGHMIHRMYVDGGSLMEILYEHCFNRLRPKIKSQMVPATTSLTGFSGETIWPLGQLRLLVIIGDDNHSTRAWMNFMIVRSLSPYNGIIGRPGIRTIQAVSSTVHEMLKFPIEGGIVTIHSTVLIPTECTSVITSSAVSEGEMTRPANFKVALHPDFPDQERNTGSTSEKDTHLSGKRKGVRPLNVLRPYKQSWRMCVDFTDLNKACPQDCYPLPKIDWKVESLSGYPFKCFLDAYKGYHQIQLAEPDEEKIAFHTGQGVYCYTKMPFGLKNAGATYQRQMDKAFESQIGQNIEVYVDDLVVKRYTEAKIMRDIEETFRTLRKVNMKLNLKKCAFGLAEGMFLGYVVTPEGIKPFSDKTTVVLQLPLPRTIKEVHSLNGKLATLNRFLSKSAKKSLPLFQTVKKCIKKSDFQWTAEAEQAFKQLKQHLSELPLLVAPKPKEELIIYLSATYGAITKRLRRYFQAHPITVITDQPIKQIMSHPDVTGPLQKWSIMLGEHNIMYRSRTSVKGQILADFLIEMPGENPQAAPAAETQQELWTLFTDGSSCVDGSDAGPILTNPEGIEFTYALRFQFAASNNEAEYEALITGLRIAARIGVKDVHVSVNSKLVANQVLGTYVAKEDNMVKYLEIVKSLLRALVQTGTGISTQRQIHKREVGGNSDRGGRTDLDDTDSGLFKRKNSPRRQEGGKKAPLQGPTIRVNEGNSLQAVVPYAVVKMCWTAPGGIPRPITRSPQQPLTPITATWPFYKWGIDIAGLFPKGPGKVKFLIVAMDYFTKWIEAKAVATITGGQIKKFEWDNIVCCFGISGEIVSNNGKQFSDNPFKDWCDKLNITQRFASVKHPQSNGLVERANRSLGEGIKSRLGGGNKNWVEELPHVLWAHRTMIKSSHGDTPFSLTYGTEAVIPTDIGMPTYRTIAVEVVSNDEELRLNLNLLEERRERAAICEAKAKSKMTKYYNARVRDVTFRPGDFVYHSNDASYAVSGEKLGPKWEGPYEVTKALKDGAYKLRSMDGTILPRTWNIANLKRCYL